MKKPILQLFVALSLLLLGPLAYAQSGDLISRGNIGVWDYYIFNENSGLWSSMNGLAAWFNGSQGFIRSAALLGALIGIFMFMFEGISGSPRMSGRNLVTWFFFLATMGLSGTARVTNVYNGQVTVIANVPALALVPASLFSTGGFKVFTSLDTALQSASGSYMSVSRHGFVGPLDTLLTLRSKNSYAARPNLNKSLAQVVSDCGSDPDKTASVPLARATDALAWLQENGKQSGLTRIFKADDASQTGTLVGCAEGLAYINTQFTTLASGGTNAESSLAEQINQGSRSKRSFNQDTGVGGTRKTNSQAIDDLNSGFGLLVSAAVSTQQNAVQFTKNAITASMIANSLDCINTSGSITTPDTCQVSAMGLADGLERWKTDSAMAGSGFLKTMFTSMGFLQALFFGMFPIVVVFGLLMMSRIPKVLGGYLFFGAWCQSWLLVVAPIQAYVQNSVLEDVNRAMGTAGGASPGLTMGNVNVVYDTLSMKLAMAGDLMASSQMLSLAILSGSMIALSSLANKWSAERQMDSSLVQPKTADSASLVKHAPMFSTTSVSNGQGGVSTRVAGADAAKGSITSTVVSAQTITSGAQVSEGQSEALNSMIQAAIQKTHGNTFTTEQSKQIAAETGNSLKATMGASGLVGAGITRAYADAFKGAGIQLSAAQEQSLVAAAEQAQGQAIKQLASQDKGFMEKLTKGNAQERAEAWGKVAEVAMGTAVMAAAIGMVATGPVGQSVAARAMAGKGAMAATVGSKVKEFLMNSVDKGGKVGLAAAGAITVGNLASAVAGDIKPMAQAMTDAGVKTTEAWKATNQNSKSTQASVSFTEGFNKTAQAASGISYALTSSEGNTTTSSITLDTSTMNRYGQNADYRQKAAEARANKASNMSSSQIQAVEQKVADAMAGNYYADSAVQEFAANTFFTHFASGGDVSAIFAKGGNRFGVTGAGSMEHLTGKLEKGADGVGQGVLNASRGGNVDYNNASRQVANANVNVGGNVAGVFKNGEFRRIQESADKAAQKIQDVTVNNPVSVLTKPDQPPSGGQPESPLVRQIPK